MAGRKVAVNVTTPDESGRMVTIPAGTEVSAEVAKQIDNPKVWGEEESADSEPAPAKKATAKRSASK